MSERGGPEPVPLADLPGRPCPAAAALEVVGERWSLLVVRELLLGSSRFTDILRGTGAPRDRVTARLRSLEAAGIVVRRRYQDAPPRDDYLLTEAGLALGPVVRSLVSWGRTWAVAPDDPLRERSVRAPGAAQRSRRGRMMPSWATVATRDPSGANTRPIESPRPPCAEGDHWS